MLSMSSQAKNDRGSFALSPAANALLLTALNAMPRIALVPLFILWFGLGVGSKVAQGFSLAFFIILSSTVAGIRGQIQLNNMDAIPLEKVPKVAVYSPPDATPWDDAVTDTRPPSAKGERGWDETTVEWKEG